LKPITENIIEESTIDILQSLGWEYINGAEISPEGLFCERENYAPAILTERLRKALPLINPGIPNDALEAAIQKYILLNYCTTTKNFIASSWKKLEFLFRKIALKEVTK
jgi:type I site-specific restriction-modification system R (restriction) subunit